MRVLQYSYSVPWLPKLPKIYQEARVWDYLLLLLLWITRGFDLSAFCYGRARGCETESIS